MDRFCLPGEFYLDAAIISWRELYNQWVTATDQQPGNNWALVAPPGPEVLPTVLQAPPHIALRWVLNPCLGIPLAPFTVWRRKVGLREPSVAIPGWHPTGGGNFAWDGVSEMLRIELDLMGATASALGIAAKGGTVAIASSAGGNVTVVLEGGPMTAVQLIGTGSVLAARGLSVNTMANGTGWTKFEIVGLPVDAASMAGIYYKPDVQGLVAALTDPKTAAGNRLKNWGPKLGWMALKGLPPWVAPNPAHLLDEYNADLLPGLRKVLANQPPPNLDKQRMEEVVVNVPRLLQRWGPTRALNTGNKNEKSQMRVRPLQSLTSSVSSDAWASLALGFGTGTAIGSAPDQTVDDFMVTAPWSGFMRVEKEIGIAWPWLSQQPTVEITIPVNREVVAVVLAPKARPWPAAPAAMSSNISYFEGTPILDGAYRTAASVHANRPDVMPGRPRVSAYGLARLDAPTVGGYEMRSHPLAGGHIPIGTAQPIPDPMLKPDPAVPADKVVLRDSGVPMPITGAPKQYQYSATAADLFGRFGPWARAWLSVPPAAVLTPSVVALIVKASPGPGNADPCQLTITADVQWDWNERSPHRIQLMVQVYDPPAPPALIPPPTPPGVFNPTVTVTFAGDFGSSPEADVKEMSDEGDNIFVPPQRGVGLRRFRVKITGFPVTYGNAIEKAIAVWVRGEETIRPNEWSGFAGPKEAAIAPNPIVPPTPPRLPVLYPLWASLPDPSGVSRATVKWIPSSAQAYRIYEATEASLLAVCGQAGPVLTDGYGMRLQKLFDLYKVASNLPKLRSVYRKTDPEPLNPLVQSDGMKHHDVVLPRGSTLIHCFIAVALTPANEVSEWPLPEADGRKGFLAYVIPRLRRPVMPKISAALDGDGIPQITVIIGGNIPPTQIKLYRGANARLAREVGSMQLIATVPPTANSETTIIADPGATPSWHRLQYRAVLVTGDDPDHAGAAVPSLPSKAYAVGSAGTAYPAGIDAQRFGHHEDDFNGTGQHPIAAPDHRYRRPFGFACGDA
jgi:hypothetical protein